MSFIQTGNYGAKVKVYWANGCLLINGSNGDEGFSFSLSPSEAQRLSETIGKELYIYPVEPNEANFIKNNKIRLIKMLRSVVPQYGLKEAKDMVDKYQYQKELENDKDLARIISLKKDYDMALALLDSDKMAKFNRYNEL